MTRYSMPFPAILLATTALCTTTAARAQNFTGAVTLGYANTSTNNGDDSVDTYGLQGILDADFGNGLSIAADS